MPILVGDTVSINWIYPPNFVNLSEDERQGYKTYCVHLSGVSDGTGENRIRKIILSDLRMPGGDKVTRTKIRKIEFNISGAMVTLEWDRAPYELIANLGGIGCFDWEKAGGLVDPSGSGDSTGDILLSTNSPDVGDSYEITIWFDGKNG